MLDQYLALIDLLSKGSIAIQQSYYFYQTTKCYLCIFTEKARIKSERTRAKSNSKIVTVNITRNNHAINQNYNDIFP